MRHAHLYVGLTLVAAAAGCGRMALDGVRDGATPAEVVPQERVPIPPLPPLPPAPPAVRTFKGDITDPVTIASGERVVFVLSKTGTDPGSPPVFHAPVTVGAGAGLIGAARFLDTLVIDGSEKLPVIWQLDPAVGAETRDVKINWTTLTSGPVTLGAVAGKISTVRNSRFTGTAVTLRSVADAQIDVSWSEFTGADVAVAHPAPGAGTGSVLLRLASNEFQLTTVHFRQLFDARLQTIEANNFLGLLDNTAYFTGVDDHLLADFEKALGSRNYVVAKDAVAATAGGLGLSPYLTSWMRLKLMAGPGGGRPMHMYTGSPQVYVTVDERQYGDLDQSERFYIYGANGSFLSSYTLYWATFSAATAEAQNYSAKGVPPGGAMVLKITLGQPTGCTAAGNHGFECPQPFTAAVAGALAVNGGPQLASMSVDQPFTVAKDSHYERQSHEAVLELFGRFADDGWLVQVPVYTPYF